MFTQHYSLWIGSINIVQSIKSNVWLNLGLSWCPEVQLCKVFEACPIFCTKIKEQGNKFRERESCLNKQESKSSQSKPIQSNLRDTKITPRGCLIRQKLRLVINKNYKKKKQSSWIYILLSEVKKERALWVFLKIISVN